MAEISTNVSAELVLSPLGHVYLNSPSSNNEVLTSDIFEQLRELFSQEGHIGLLHLGLKEFSFPFPPSFLFWQSFSRAYITRLCKLPQQENDKENPEVLPLPEAELIKWINNAPCMKGGEYLNLEVLMALWKGLMTCFQKEFNQYAGSLQAYLSRYNPRWNSVGRVCFHLAENKNDPTYPFAFLATYTSQLSESSSPQHLPLKKALQDYAGEKNHSALLALLMPVQKAANQSPFIKNLVDAGSVFHPLKWSEKDAYRFLKDITVMEASGIMVRVPNWWNAQKPPRPKLSMTIGGSPKGIMGLNALLDFDIQLTLEDGTPLTQDDLNVLLSSPGPLIKIKGQWVEVDPAKLQFMLSHWKKLEKASKEGVSLTEGMRLLAGGHADFLSLDNQDEFEAWQEGSKITAGEWLKTTLNQLKNPSLLEGDKQNGILKQHLNASLRGYQIKGVQWLWLLYQLKLGGCLADDMGLGKTIQVIALLLLIKDLQQSSNTKKPHLLVVPASLIGNWQAEVRRFAPQLNIMLAHSSMGSSDKISSSLNDKLHEIDVVLTTYGYIQRLETLQNMEWDLIVLDEAQSIKNPGAKQTRFVKALKSQVRLALTGTPVENRLGDLWSLFDFTSPGLLGSSKQFNELLKKANKQEDSGHYSRVVSTLRKLTQPYILRRLKSDKSIISDLPDKTEMQAYCSLSKIQIQLYQQAIQELEKQLKEAAGIQRRGLVLSFLLRFKQICNHPSQWLGYGDYAETSSGKFLRLREICEEIAAKQEKVLIFTQFKEIIPALAAFLTQIFGRQGLTLDGDTAIKKRPALVDSFQQELGPPFLVLSLKAGGTGLNLTRASHVIHFDRWWNPAVENQATDRAYRIGQKQAVLVHKFICRGTIEEKIDEMIGSKKSMSQELLSEGGDVLLTELSNDELLDLISLDLKRAISEI